ncbi:transposase [Solemya pervernicosa gill symbiont]|uniref:Transposase n=1 Tax=Solemya pervernicosa gill symbiont TaxID=642797 RepID=A0A1T2L932_9GAMM|nr:transposase [Solemya pervernicosa gill symbiont]OOZ41615.1 transposase [Solemya pervernicosa gill symbiont]
MPRLPRYVFSGQPQHVIQRENNRNPIFVADEDYACFRHHLYKASNRPGCHIHAWVFMTNYLHLLLTPVEEESIAKTMQSVGRRYVQYFNAIYQRTGTLWEGRYKATLIDSDRYLFTCHRYIELNPVRAHMVSHPGEYPWSSYAANALGKHDKLLTPHKLYLGLGDSAVKRESAYRQLFSTHLDEKTLEEIRQSTQKGWALGSEHFVMEVERLLERRVQPLARGGDHRSQAYKDRKR